jgi:DNA polymerase/3'-5' exonuclease PolX
MSSNTTSVVMNLTTAINYIRELENKNEQLEKELKELKAKMQKSSLYETTARTKTYQVNEDIAEYLRELGEMTSDFYKTAAYRRAADIITNLSHEVESGESLLPIDGIGKNIAARIDEFLDEYYEDEDSDTESIASTDGQIIIDDSDSESEIDSDSESNFFVSYNSDLTDAFDKLASYEEDPHKRDAYRAAADAIYKLPFEIKSGSELAQGPKKVKGIGKGIAKKINEFLETGNIKKLEKIEYPNQELADIFDSLCYHETDEFKKAAYDDAAYAISKLTFKVTSGEELSKGPKKIPGIGKGIAKKIDEFLETGKIKRLEELKKSTSTNEEIAWALEALASLEAEPHGSQDPFKIRAYRRAAEIIRELNFEVTSGEEIAKGPKKIEGIGAGIGKKIDEFLQTGKIQRIEELTR